MDDILVSVLICTYKRDKDLQRALNSLVDQTHKNFEVVLVDDNGNAEFSSKVKAIVDSFEGKLNINYEVNEKNMGSAFTRNRTIALAKGEYVTFLDDDDLYLPEKIEKQLEVMVQNNADYCISDQMLYNENDVLIDKRIRSYIKSDKVEDLMKYNIMHKMAGANSFMFKTDYIRKIGGFPGIDVGDDLFLMREAILGGGKFAYANHCYFKAYIHNGEGAGLSSGESKIKGAIKIYETNFRDYSYLTPREQRYVKMRHYAVIAFAEIRRKRYGAFLKNAFIAGITDPIGCINVLISHN